MATLNLGKVKGTTWYTGTGITGKSTSKSVFADSGVKYAIADDLYINTDTGYFYKCATSGDADTATWVYLLNPFIGDSADNTITFDSSDVSEDSDATSWSADTEALTSGDSHATLLNKISIAIKNLKYLFNFGVRRESSSLSVGGAAVPAYVTKSGTATACTVSATYTSSGTALFTRAGAYNLYKYFRDIIGTTDISSIGSDVKTAIANIYSEMTPTAYSTDDLSLVNCSIIAGGYARIGNLVVVNMEIKFSSSAIGVYGLPQPLMNTYFAAYNYTQNEQMIMPLAIRSSDSTGYIYATGVTMNDYIWFNFAYIAA